MVASSRAFVVGVFRFVLVTMLASVILVGTTLLISALTAWMANGEWTSPHFLSIGFVCAQVAWLFVVVFHVRRETQSIPFSQRDQFVLKAKSTLHEMGYALTWARGNTLSFRPHFHSYLFGGGIYVAIHEHEARLTGPKVSLDVFRRYFRLLNHVQRVQMYLQEQRKFTETIIKRAELQIRIDPDQFDSVRKHVIDVLEKDATVICELNLLVQSDKGIRENTLEFQIREWLEQRQIPVEIHKDLVQFVEVVQPELEAEAVAP